MMTDVAEQVFLRSYANDPTPLAERTTASILDEIQEGAGSAVHQARLCQEILERCAIYERRAR